MKKIIGFFVLAFIVLASVTNYTYAQEVWDETYLRSHSARGVSFDVLFLNPIVPEEYPEQLAFRMFGGTHGGDLTRELSAQNIIVKTNERQAEQVKLTWASKSSHHPEMFLFVDKSLITPGTTEVVIDIQNLRGEVHRVLKWTKEEGIDFTQLGGANQSTVAYVTNAAAGTISLIDTKTHTMIKTVQVGEKASHGVTGIPHDAYYYAGTGEKQELVVVDQQTDQIVKKLQVDSSLHGIDIRPDGKEVYLAGGSFGVRGDVYIYSAEKQEIVGKVETNGAGHITFSKDGKYAFVSNHDQNEVVVIDVAKRAVFKRIPVGEGPNKGLLSPDQKYLYVANHLGGTVSVVDLQSWTVVAEFATDAGAHDLDFSQDGQQLWVANSDAKSVMVFTMPDHKLVKKIRFTGGVNHIAVVPHAPYVYLTDPIKNQLVVIHAETYEVEKEISLGKEPHEITFLPKQ